MESEHKGFIDMVKAYKNVSALRTVDIFFTQMIERIDLRTVENTLTFADNFILVYPNISSGMRLQTIKIQKTDNKEVFYTELSYSFGTMEIYFDVNKKLKYLLIEMHGDNTLAIVAGENQVILGNQGMPREEVEAFLFQLSTVENLDIDLQFIGKII
jgi:hypothetical protein